MPGAIAVNDLQMRYGTLQAVNDVSFEVSEGEIFALLGPNGAGKTTTIEILEGHRRRTAGDVSVLGYDPERAGRRFRERVGIMLQSGGIDPELTVRETVKLFAGLYRRPRPVAQTIELVGLSEYVRARVGTLSGGTERRLDLALALIGDPDVVFLDEPTTGFDPSARRAAWDALASLRDLGKTVLLSTHYMDEVEHLADRVAVLRNGKIVAESTPRRLGGRDVARALISFAIAAGDATGKTALPSGPWTVIERKSVDDGREEFVVATDDAARALYVLTAWSLDQGEDLVGLAVTRPSLEDAYLQLTEHRTTAAT